MKYKNPYTRQNPNLIVILVDQRVSMTDTYSEKQNRLEFSFEMINNFINELISVNIRGNEILRRVFIKLISYGGAANATILISDWIDKIAEQPIRIEPRIYHDNEFDLNYNYNVYCEPEVSLFDEGKEIESPFIYTEQTVIEWKNQRESNESLNSKFFPVPLIISFSNGSISSPKITEIVQSIKSIEFDDGNPLIYNFILGEKREDSVLFPKSEIESNFKQDILLSSDLPIEIAAVTNLMGNTNRELKGGEKACIINPESTDITKYIPMLRYYFIKDPRTFYLLDGIYGMTRRRNTNNKIDTLKGNEIFVFGSNLQGQHGGGAARTALQWGAVMGQGVGLQGQTYAIPTMFSNTDQIKPYVDEFIEFAKQNPNLTFLVTAIGCGIAGWSVEQIAPMFAEALHVNNVFLPEEFWKIIIDSY